MADTFNAARPIVNRRAFIIGGTAALSGLSTALAAPQLRLDGLYEEPWLVKTSSKLSTDYAAAASAKKNFAILWETRGCPWCKLLHTVNFARGDIEAYLQENFGLLQLNIRGSAEIADFDGEALPEESLSLKYNVNSTPTLQFFTPSDASTPRELGRVGYLKPDQFLLMLRFVREKGYEQGPFETWAKRRGKAS